jgi:hypothetical protein
VQPPSNVQLLSVAIREPLFADWTNKHVGGHAGHTPIAAVHAGWLRPDDSHPHSPPLPSIAFVLFNKREQFFVMDALVHAVKPVSLTPRFR